MKFHRGLTTFTALIGLANALPAAHPAAIPAEELTTEDIIKLSEGYLPSNFNGRKRDGCTSNNVLRLLRDKRYSESASAFCSKFIQSTITDTVLVPATITTETTETPPPTFVTVTDLSILTETDTSTSTLFIPTTDVPIPKIAKRSQIAYPSWLSTQYSPSRVSSACSCFITAPSNPTHVTNTIVTGTTTAFSKTITLPPVVSTVTESVTTITTITSIVGTSKIINCKVTPACRTLGSLPLDLLTGYTYEQCKTRCLETEGCLSIQFGVAGSVQGACLLSASTVEDTYGEISRESPICAWWYMDDVECIYLD
ncbi:hypothetical protein TWF569_009360 [Orbilia oligospora]|nr:hypothetical protein TWF706_003431 [Orbilia oligospora]KAF3121116.1 hypothetical protein TWF703_002043 [Orbilia oligospora]KAF3136731.1 hypothetical protein TWF569_009360 [Orbilia oligospora]